MNPPWVRDTWFQGVLQHTNCGFSLPITGTPVRLPPCFSVH